MCRMDIKKEQRTAFTGPLGETGRSRGLPFTTVPLTDPEEMKHEATGSKETRAAGKLVILVGGTPRRYL